MKLPIEEALLPAPGHGVGLLELDEALEALARIDRRKSRLVECATSAGSRSTRRRRSSTSPRAPRNVIGCLPRRGCSPSCRATGRRRHGVARSPTTAWPASPAGCRRLRRHYFCRFATSVILFPVVPVTVNFISSPVTVPSYVIVPGSMVIRKEIFSPSTLPFSSFPW